ncbi:MULTISPECIES: hypothetical protein [unclassified Streptomyces]|uniref:hypothetical protein n=1 Tax=unclassified Streptomyces TaxID=2593676 RepID=UPI0011AFFE39|nr:MULTISPECIES: hypothetical protein [unclassified Streptomyces]
MIWWLRTRRLPVLALALGGYWLLVLPFGHAALPVPQLGGATSADVPLLLFAPLLPVVALIVCCGGATASETAAVRRVGAFDALLAVALPAATAVAVAGVAGVAGGWFDGGDPAPWQAVRNLGCCLGLALLGRAALGRHAATLLPTLAVLTVAVFGYGPEQAAHWWAWPAAAATEPLSWAGSAVLLAAGLHRTVRRDLPARW